MVGEITTFLESKGWVFLAQNKQYVVYTLPSVKDLTISIPTSIEAEDFEFALNNTLAFLSKIYGAEEIEKNFIPIEYISSLRKHALYFRILPKASTFKDSIGLASTWRFLKNISDSFNEYAKIKMNELAIQNDLSLRKSRNILTKYFSLRVVSLNYSSFGIGVSPDFYMGDEKLKLGNDSFTQWRKDNFSTFCNDVIYTDLSNEDDVDRIMTTYSGEERNRIFKPLVRSYSNAEINIFLSNQQYESIKPLVPVSTNKRDDFFPLLESVVKENNKEFQLMQILIPIEKGKNKLSIDVKNLQQSLFSTELEGGFFQVDGFVFDNRKIEFNSKQDLKVTFDKESQQFISNFEPLSIDIQGETLEEISHKFNQVLSESYELYSKLSSKQFDQQLELDDEKLIDFFDQTL